MRAGRRLSLELVAVLALSFVSPARASAEAAQAVSVEWRGPDAASGCIDAPGLVEAVEDGLGRPVFGARGTALVVAVSIERREGAGWRAHVQLRGPRGATLGERELVSETESCASLSEPLVFAVMLMVDSELPKRAQPPAPTPEPRRRDRRAGSSGASPTLSVDGAALGAFGLLPEPTLGGALGGELVAWRWLGLRAHLAAMIPRARSAAPSAETRFGLYAAGLLLCPGAAFGGLRVAGCAGAEAGVLTARSEGLDAGDEGGHPFLALSAGLRTSVRVYGRTRVTSSATALFPQRRERFVYTIDEQQRVLFEMARVCAVVGLGASVEF